ncbi:MAG TPA: prepilin-type N-terminal cleavage/methylation domain-containing protein [Acidobacteriota bacterium]
MRIRLNKKGFTLIELLIVVAIIGIIAAIAIPNLLNAIQRGKQKRTMADMRAVGTAVEAFAVDNNRYPDDASSVSNITDDIEPIYIKKVPTGDGWQQAFDYTSSPDTAAQSYSIQSYGKNREQEAPCNNAYKGITTNFNNDICFSQGSFTMFPEGIQQ